MANSEHVCVYRHVRLLVDHGSDHIGRFSSDPRKRHEFVYRHGYVSTGLGHQLLGHADQVLCFVVGIGNASDQGEDVLETGF